MLGFRGTPSQFVLYGLKNMCAKFDAFTQFVTIFPLTDRTNINGALVSFASRPMTKNRMATVVLDHKTFIFKLFILHVKGPATYLLIFLL